MPSAIISTTNVKNTMPKLSQLVPNLARATLRAIAPSLEKSLEKSLANKRSAPTLQQFSTEDLIDRLIVPVSEEDPDTHAVLEIADRCTALLKTYDWLGLSDVLIDLDQHRRAVPSGKRIIDVVLHLIRDNMSDLYVPATALNCDTSFVHNKQILNAIEAAHLLHPENYMIAALLARLHLDCAWSARGAMPIEKLDNAIQEMIRDHSRMVRDVITKFDPIAHNSPLLAEIQYGFVALRDPNLSRLICAFDDWVELDPTNLTPYRHHAFFIHTLHSRVDDALIETEAHRAASLGEDIMGAGGYAVMYLQALKFNRTVFTYLDETTFCTGFNDLMRALNNDPVRLIYLLEQVVACFPDPSQPDYAAMMPAAQAKSTTVRLSLAPIIRENLGFLYCVAWTLEETDFLHAIAPSFAEELSRGATVELTESGIVVTDPAIAS